MTLFLLAERPLCATNTRKPERKQGKLEHLQLHKKNKVINCFTPAPGQRRLKPGELLGYYLEFICHSNLPRTIKDAAKQVWDKRIFRRRYCVFFERLQLKVATPNIIWQDASIQSICSRREHFSLSTVGHREGELGFHCTCTRLLAHIFSRRWEKVGR